MTELIIFVIAIALLVAAIAAIVASQDRASNVIVACPICGEKTRLKKTYVRRCAVKQTLKEFAKNSFPCKRIVSRRTECHGAAYWTDEDVGCGADITPLFLTDKFIKDIFLSADQLRFQNQNVKFLIDSIDAETKEFEEAVKSSHQRLLL